MNNQISITEFIELLISLSSSNKFKSFVENYAYHNFEYSEISEDFLKIKFHDRDPETGEYFKGEFSIEEYIYKSTLSYLGNDFNTKILQVATPKEIEKLINGLKVGLNALKEDEFFRHQIYFKQTFTLFVNRLIKVQKIIAKPTTESLGEKTQKISKKKQNALDLKTYLDVIINSESFKEALSTLQKEFPSLQLQDPNAVLYRGNSGNPNKSQVAKLLAEIAILKYGKSNDCPSDSTIYTYLFR